MNAQNQKITIVMKKQHVQIFQEVILAIVIQDIQEMVSLATVFSFFFFLSFLFFLVLFFFVDI